MTVSKFFDWYDAECKAAMASPVGKALLAHNPGWHVAHTGGGCLAWELILPGDCWLWITDTETGIPDSVDAPCLVGFYDNEDNFLDTDALNLADALNEANHFIAMGRPPAGSNG